MKVLVIEDNPRLSDRIKHHLRKHYLIETAHSGDTAIGIVSSQAVDIILLDLGLPDMPGLEVCQKIRELGVTAPIIVLTGTDDVLNKVELLNAGADDYLTKPFDATELKARINALERRRERKPPENNLTADNLILSPSTRIVTRAGALIELRRKEFDILEYLLKNKGRVLSRQNIINHAWTSSTATWTGSVDVHIKQLRDKIDRPFRTRLIKTTYGVGYSIEDSEKISNHHKVR